jgi:hypothetical protein
MELGYRALPISQTVRENRQKLRDALEAEKGYALMTKLVASIDCNSAFCTVEEAIPCIMHGGNGINEKIVMMVLIEAWESCSTAQEKEQLIKIVEDYINSRSFGTEESKAQWKLPMTKEKELETVSFTAWTGRNVIEN